MSRWEKRPVAPRALSVLEQRLQHGLAVVVKRAQHAGNLGRLARFMHNMGVTELRLVDPFTKDVSRAVRGAVHARALVERAFERPYATVAAALEDRDLVLGTCQPGSRPRAEKATPPLDPRAAAARVVTALAGGGARAALLLGSEKWGLANDDLARCHALVAIPSRADYPSLNLSHAGLLFLYELRRACLDPAPAPDDAPRATAGEVDAAAKHLGAAAVAVRFGREREDVEAIVRAALLGRPAGPEAVRTLGALFARLERAAKKP